jgi:hypothetical protein
MGVDRVLATGVRTACQRIQVLVEVARRGQMQVVPEAIQSTAQAAAHVCVPRWSPRAVGHRLGEGAR